MLLKKFTQRSAEEHGEPGEISQNSNTGIKAEETKEE
jgi:hypothetical protein